jgi:hypothetical protein
VELHRDARFEQGSSGTQVADKEGFKSYRLLARNYNPLLYDCIKEEVERLLEAGFIQTCRYAEWVSNIVPVEKRVRAR